MQLFTSQLFLHGYIADPALAASLADDLAAGSAHHPVSRSHAMDLFKSLMYLGGRPMHAGHNYDLDEPFEPSFGNRVATERVFGKTLSQPQPKRRRRETRLQAQGVVQGCG